MGRGWDFAAVSERKAEGPILSEADIQRLPELKGLHLVGGYLPLLESWVSSL